MKVKYSVLDYIIYKQLNWYGHVQRINEERLRRKFWNGVHQEKKGLQIRRCGKYKLE